MLLVVLVVLVESDAQANPNHREDRVQMLLEVAARKRAVQASPVQGSVLTKMVEETVVYRSPLEWQVRVHKPVALQLDVPAVVLAAEAHFPLESQKLFVLVAARVVLGFVRTRELRSDPSPT